MNNKVVILGNNYYIGLSVIRCLGVHGIHTVAADYSEESRYGVKSKYCTEKIIVPHYQKEPEKFIYTLIEYAKKQDKKPVLFPCHDSYLEVIDAHLDEIRKYYLIPQTEQGLYRTVMNKETLHKLAKENGVKVPETLNIDEDNFHQKVEHTIKFPCLVKPVDSPSFVKEFRKKLFIVHSIEEMEEKIELAKNANLEVIIQRIIPGFDDHMYTFDAYLNQESKVTHWTTGNKFRQYPINFGASVFTIQKHVPELYEIGARFLENIKYKGFAEIEFKKDAETGEYYLIEINARITNFNSLLCKIGLNFPYITYMDLIGESLEPKTVEYNTNTAFWYAFEDVLAVKNYMKTKQLSFIGVIKTLFRPKAYAIWDWKDPKPAFSFTFMMLGKLLKKAVK